jgi:proteasome accessory factor C
MSRPGAAERLSRLLAIVPWIVAQDGPRVTDVCERFGVSERDLIADLNLLFMCGVYPYTPDTLIEVDIDGGRVWVRFADWFTRPLRLTPPEGLALMAAARAILGVPQTGLGTPRPRHGTVGPGPGEPETGEPQPGGTRPGGEPPGRPVGLSKGDERGALATALAKLEMVVGAGGEEALDVELGLASADVLRTLQLSLKERRKVLVDYYSFGRDETGERVVQPWRLFSSGGHWYLLAWCEKVAGKRLFRVDRVRSAVVLAEQFDPPADLGPVSVYEGSPDDPLVVLDLAPGARWIAEQYPNEGVVDLGDDNVRIRLRASSRAWLERLLLRAGPDATVISGADGVVPAAARRLLSVYGHVTFGNDPV